MPLTLERVRQLLGPAIGELAGAHLSGQIPLTAPVLNGLVAEYLSAADTPITSADVRVRDGGELRVRIHLRKPAFAPPLTVLLRVEQQPVFPSPAVLGLHWSVPGFGVLTALAGPMLSLFKRSPPWLVVHGSHASIDVTRALRENGLPEIADSLAALEITTREGAVLARFELRVRG